MQRNDVPNLYASEKTIPAMTGQRSWNRLEKSKNVQNALKSKPFSTLRALKLKVT
jgi:hypothetical protein